MAASSRGSSEKCCQQMPRHPSQRHMTQCRRCCSCTAAQGGGRQSHSPGQRQSRSTGWTRRLIGLELPDQTDDLMTLFFFLRPKKKPLFFQMLRSEGDQTRFMSIQAANAQQVVWRCCTKHEATTHKLHPSQNCLILCHHSGKSKPKAWYLACAR